uniref:Uncharacterized protein n=1 Tax=Rhizophora mucronata TaxID=61149 RepID=A0A2P2JFQ5_RHIMU
MFQNDMPSNIVQFDRKTKSTSTTTAAAAELKEKQKMKLPGFLKFKSKMVFLLLLLQSLSLFSYSVAYTSHSSATEPTTTTTTTTSTKSVSLLVPASPTSFWWPPPMTAQLGPLFPSLPIKPFWLVVLRCLKQCLRMRWKRAEVAPLRLVMSRMMPFAPSSTTCTLLKHALMSKWPVTF